MCGVYILRKGKWSKTPNNYNILKQYIEKKKLFLMNDENCIIYSVLSSNSNLYLSESILMKICKDGVNIGVHYAAFAIYHDIDNFKELCDIYRIKKTCHTENCINIHHLVQILKNT